MQLSKSTAGLVLAGLMTLMTFPQVSAVKADGASLEEARKTCLGDHAPGPVVDSACTVIIEAGHESRTDQAEAYFRRGNSRQRYGRLYQAFQDWNRAASMNSKHVPAQLALGRWQFMSNRFDLAIARYRLALKTDESNTEAMNGMGMALLRLKEYDRALEVFEKVAAIDPGLWRTWVGIGKVQEHRGDVDAALESYAKAIEVVPTSRSGYFMQVMPPPEMQRAFLLIKLERTEEAIADLSKLLVRDPRRIGARGIRAAQYAKLLKYDLAIADYSILADMPHPEIKVDALFGRARIHQKSGNEDAALADMVEIIKVGGVQGTLKLQVYLKNNGFDQVEINGKYNVDMRDALMECMKRPACAQGIASPI